MKSRTFGKARHEQTPGHFYWVPLVVLYSGARAAELAQLSLEYPS